MSIPNSPFRIAFPISASLREEVAIIIDRFRTQGKTRDTVNKLTDIVIELTETGSEYLFVDSIKYAGASNFQIKAVHLALNTARKAIGMVGRQILKAMPESQLVKLMDFLEEIVLEVVEEA